MTCPHRLYKDRMSGGHERRVLKSVKNMKLSFSGKITKSSMILLIVAALFTAVSAFTSVWRIDLSAPQYPEGMVLYIGGTEGVSGGDDGNDLYKINELNHYVGMAQIHPGDFWEFTVLPILLCAFAVLFLVAAIMKSKKLSIASLISFGIFGILGFVDFYHWTYVYGHNLSPDATELRRTVPAGPRRLSPGCCRTSPCLRSNQGDGCLRKQEELKISGK